MAARLQSSFGRECLATLVNCLPLQERLLRFWLQAENRRASTWIEHADINDVMLATSVAPEGFLTL